MQENKEPIRPITWIIVGIAAFFIAGYFGFNQFTNYQKQKSDKERLTQEQEQKTKEAQDLEIAKLKEEMEVLKNTKPQTIIKQVSAPQTQQPKDNLPSIIQQWRPRIAYIDCKFVFKDVNMGQQSGSGYILGQDTQNGNIILFTNKHVVEIVTHYPDGTPTGFSIKPMPTSCDIKIPGDYQYATINSDAIAVYDQIDVAMIIIKNPTSHMRSVLSNYGAQFCTKRASLGEQLLVLGYPGIGDQNDVTVTDGIISGYEGSYYITSAKVEHGTSGGAAISVKDNCYLGIPSYASVGSVESMARIFNITKLP
jgi:hypothetical protein